MERFDEALLMAARLHRGQVHEGTGMPRVAHALAVAVVAFEYGASEDEAIAALLHEAVDVGGEGMLAEVRAAFGEPVADIVLGGSRSVADDDWPGHRGWEERTREAVARVADAPAAVCLVAAADALCGVRDLLRDHRSEGDAMWARVEGGRDGAAWHYGALADALWRRWPSALTRDLRAAAGEL